MKTKITKIVKESKGENNSYFVIHFIFFNEPRFTYLNKIALDYWKNKGLKGLKVGQEINVIMLKDKIHFKIIGFEK